VEEAVEDVDESDYGIYVDTSSHLRISSFAKEMMCHKKKQDRKEEASAK